MECNNICINKSKSHAAFLSLIDAIKRQNEIKKILVLRGKKSFELSGAIKLLQFLYDDSMITVKTWDEFSSNPKREHVNIGVEVMNTFNPDFIIAVGGGSVIDMAKLVRFYSLNPNVPLLAIPTTSGTGAESTKFAVCYKGGVKMSICHESILPNYVYLDSNLTWNNSDYLTACTGFDALAQAIEAYWNINATEKSDELALNAISLLFDNLIDTAKANEPKRRYELMLGANFAGQAINITRTTAPHAMSYTFTSKYGYPHGHAVALTFPAFFNLNVNCNEENYLGTDYFLYNKKMKKLLKLLGKSSEMDSYVFMKEYVHKLGLSFDSHRPFDRDVVVKGINLERAKNNPHALNEEIIYKVINSIN